MRRWAACCALLCSAARAAPAAQSPAPVDALSPATPAAQQGAVPDDDFIEFLGLDDVGDAAWWDFLNKAMPRKEPSSEPPPQDATQ